MVPNYEVLARSKSWNKTTVKAFKDALYKEISFNKKKQIKVSGDHYEVFIDFKI